MLIAGVDEAGRGPLAGPVVSAAVILDPKKPIQGLKDSKLLTEKQRETLFDKITQRAIAFGVGFASVLEIETLNILKASLLSMQRAVAALKICPHKILVDGNHCPDFGIEAMAIIGGDKTEAAISAASILAKVTRDRMMVALDTEYPGYGLASHKGYATKMHQEALQRLGPSPIHRKSFMPVKLIFDKLLLEQALTGID